MKTGTNMNSRTRRKRVFLLDHFPLSRLAVREWVKATPDLSLCGEADAEDAALSAVGRLQPDVVVTEVLRQQDLGFIRSLHKKYPQMPILVFSFRDEGWYAPLALEAGADGYLMKGVSPTGLLDGIRATLQGRVVLSPDIRARLLLKCARGGRRSPLARRARPCRSSSK
jgi:DNA-binding NarL/FixJ family response regulator